MEAATVRIDAVPKAQVGAVVVREDAAGVVLEDGELDPPLLPLVLHQLFLEARLRVSER
jgi:hypothetical protein